MLIAERQQKIVDLVNERKSIRGTELSKKKEITVISTGGTLLPESLSYVGPLAETALDTYYVTKAFISCIGLHFELGLSETDEQQARVKQKMIDSVEMTYIMIDYSKFGKQAVSRVSGLDDVNHIIIDSKVDETVVQQLEDNSLHVIKVMKN